jgi:hypothetical protein
MKASPKRASIRNPVKTERSRNISPSCLEQILFDAGKGRWRMALTIGLAGLGMAAAPMTARAEAGSEADWKASLNHVWKQLSTRQQLLLFVSRNGILGKSGCK